MISYDFVIAQFSKNFQMRISVYLGWLGVCLIIMMAGMVGVVLYNAIACCDPYQLRIERRFSTNQVMKNIQLYNDSNHRPLNHAF